MKYTPPKSESELISHALSLAGATLEEILIRFNETPPCDLTRQKGYIGQLIEKVLGANAGNLDQPDFTHLGIELKTIPIDQNGLPTESTYICYANMPPNELFWQGSRVARKINHILWFPYEANTHTAALQKRMGLPFLWQPSPKISAVLQQDYEELTELMLEGRYAELSAHKGTYLQLRPKAANSSTLIKVSNESGEAISTVPKGFYFRRSFTRSIFEHAYGLS